jgi:uncharacterized protein involved in exopolysaccharide biosynthesis
MSGWGQEGSTNMPTELTEEIGNAAIEGFKAQKFRLDQHIAELLTMLKDGSPQATAVSGTVTRTCRK